MLNPRFQVPASVRGFSLIELMVSVTIGLMVAAGAVGLIVAIDRSNSEMIQSTRLTQELRALAGMVADDLKRSMRIYDPIADVGQGASVNCPTTGTLKTPLQPCYVVSTDPTGATATQCVTYGYTGTTSNSTVYNYRSVRRVVDGTTGAGDLYMDQNATIDGGTSGTAILTTAQQSTCPIPAGTSGTTTAYKLNSDEVDITSVCFSSTVDGKTCYFNTTDNACELNSTVAVAPASNEVDICVAGKMRAGDTYEKAITRAFVQPVFIRSMAVPTS